MPQETVDILVEGGKATAAPPLGPAVSAAGANVGQVIAAINEKTKPFQGMEVPVKIIVDTATKQFTIAVGTPPVSSLIRKGMKVAKLRHGKDADVKLPGSITFDAVVEIARSKDSLAGSLPARVTQVLGTCLSGGVLIDGRNPRDVIADVKNGTIAVE